MNVLVDIGGSGIKIADYSNGVIGKIERRNDIVSYDGFVNLIRKRSSKSHLKGIAISTAGFVNYEKGRVEKCKCAPYLEGDIVCKLNKEFQSAEIAVVNDGEAHARALLYPGRNVKLGAIHLALGTSVSFAVINENGDMVRTCNGENWDIGDIQLRTREVPYEVWYKLGTDGLRELENNTDLNGNPYRHFGLRMGNLLRNLAVIFRPRTIGLSGGIMVSHCDEILAGIKQEWKDEGFNAPVYSSSVEFEVIKSDSAAMEGLTTLLQHLL